MIDVANVTRLVSKLRDLISELNQEHSLVVHRQINQFYFMQKVSELEMLKNEIEELIAKQARLQELMKFLYSESFHQWRHDARWLQQHMANNKKTSLDIQDLSM